jgi:hypothetical protein
VWKKQYGLCSQRGVVEAIFGGTSSLPFFLPDITDDDDAGWQLHLAALHTDVSPQSFLQRQDSEGMDSTTRSQEEDWTTEF